MMLDYQLPLQAHALHTRQTKPITVLHLFSPWLERFPLPEESSRLFSTWRILLSPLITRRVSQEKCQPAMTPSILPLALSPYSVTVPNIMCGGGWLYTGLSLPLVKNSWGIGVPC